MTRRTIELWSPAIGAAGNVVVYGDWGRPVLSFGAEASRATDFEERGMIDVVGSLLDEGRVKIYSVDTFDSQTWSAKSQPVEERARRHGAYESWILEQVAPWIVEDCGGRADILTTGCSLGAFHAANFTLKHGHVFPQALCLSGSYEPANWSGWGERGEATYFNTPVDYVRNLHGDHLDWLRQQVFLLLVCGQGMWEDTTGALRGSQELAGLLADKGIPHELELWGHDSAHDWPWWRKQFGHYLPRFC